MTLLGERPVVIFRELLNTASIVGMRLGYSTLGDSIAALRIAISTVWLVRSS